MKVLFVRADPVQSPPAPTADVVGPEDQNLLNCPVVERRGFLPGAVVVLLLHLRVWGEVALAALRVPARFRGTPRAVRVDRSGTRAWELLEVLVPTRELP